MGADNMFILLFLVLGFNTVPSLAKRPPPDPCDLQKFPIDLNQQGECEEAGGFCFHPRCVQCQGGATTTRYDCGDNKLCCMPAVDPPPPPPPKRHACCELYRDPHIRTYDNVNYDVQVPGTFNVSKPCDSELWVVSAQFEYPNAGAVWTEITEVTVNIPGYEIIMSHLGSVTVNGNPVTPPYSGPDFEITQAGNYICVKLLLHGVVICYNKEVKSLEICVDNTWFDNTCGLCGNWNNNNDDDITDLPGGNGGGRCAQPENLTGWNFCWNALSRVLKNCRRASVETYLKACVFDFCAEGEKGAQFTIQAAKEHCTLDVKKLFMTNTIKAESLEPDPVP